MCVKYTLQETFNKIAHHMLMQGKRSMDYTGTVCKYRGDMGLKCAIGTLDPFSLLVETDSVCDEYNLEILARLGYPVNAKAQEVYERLQYVHDEVMPQDWKATLKALAFIWHLEFINR
ncbi:MAG: hypothetical protein COB09_18655 [Thalassobium sp.]|nr:MAG: hypothetical protein COB09_18655 [Thalassobium sp.]